MNDQKYVKHLKKVFGEEFYFIKENRDHSNFENHCFIYFRSHKKPTRSK